MICPLGTQKNPKDQYLSDQAIFTGTFAPEQSVYLDIPARTGFWGKRDLLLVLRAAFGREAEHLFLA